MSYNRYKEQDNYRPWGIKINSLQPSTPIEDKLRFFAQFGALAPSTHNTQPWKIDISGETAFLFHDRELMLPETDPSNRNMYISLGAFAANMMIAAGYHGFGVETAWQLDPEPRFIMKFSQQKEAHPLSSLAPLIPERFSDKSAYLDQSVPENTLGQLSELLTDQNGELAFIHREEDRISIAALHQEAGKLFAQSSAFRKELSQWLKPNNTKDKRGMPGFVAGLPLLLSYIGSLLLPVLPPLALKQIEKDAAHLRRGPVLGLITAPGDGVSDHLTVGMKYQELSLLALKNNLRMTPMTAMIENPASRSMLKEFFDIDYMPQMFFRLGYSNTSSYHTPRKRIE